MNHNTYHHFLGLGSSDSELDVLLSSKLPGVSEKLVKIECKHENPHLNSHHDLIISMATVPKLQNKQPKTSGNIIAPKIINTRHKIVWTDDGAMLLPRRGFAST